MSSSLKASGEEESKKKLEFCKVDMPSRSAVDYVFPSVVRFFYVTFYYRLYYAGKKKIQKKIPSAYLLILSK